MAADGVCSVFTADPSDNGALWKSALRASMSNVGGVESKRNASSRGDTSGARSAQRHQALTVEGSLDDACGPGPAVGLGTQKCVSNACTVCQEEMSGRDVRKEICGGG